MAFFKPFWARLALCAIAPFFVACFDYDERVILYPDFSGVVEIEYTVPVFASEDRSMLAFLPVDYRDIEDKHRSVIRAGGKLDNYAMKIFEDRSEADSDIFPRKCRVRYRVWFKDAGDLEKIVLGKANVYWRDGRVHVTRSLSTGKPLPDKPGFLARRVHAATLKSLVKRRMTFLILVPWYYELQTTRGAFVRPAEQLGSYFQVPLESTMNAGGPITWSVEIKPNPKPESGPKKTGEK